MKILVIGSGGREHAISWQCAKFDSVPLLLIKTTHCHKYDRQHKNGGQYNSNKPLCSI